MAPFNLSFNTLSTFVLRSLRKTKGYSMKYQDGLKKLIEFAAKGDIVAKFALRSMVKVVKKPKVKTEAQS